MSNSLFSLTHLRVPFYFFSNPITFRSDTVNIPAQNYHPRLGKECQILCVFFLAGREWAMCMHWAKSKIWGFIPLGSHAPSSIPGLCGHATNVGEREFKGPTCGVGEHSLFLLNG